MIRSLIVERSTVYLAALYLQRASPASPLPPTEIFKCLCDRLETPNRARDHSSARAEPSRPTAPSANCPSRGASKPTAAAPGQSIYLASGQQWRRQSGGRAADQQAAQEDSLKRKRQQLADNMQMALAFSPRLSPARSLANRPPAEEAAKTPNRAAEQRRSGSSRRRRRRRSKAGDTQ